MQNKCTVTIAGQEYTLVSTEEQIYIEQVAQYVDTKVQETMDGGRVSTVNGVVLAALNIADEYFKELSAAENLRRQLKEYLEGATKLKMELSEAKREIFKLQNQDREREILNARAKVEQEIPVAPVDPADPVES